MRIPTLFTPDVQRRYVGPGRLVALAGGARCSRLSAYLPWAYGRAALDNMTYLGGPSPLQFLGATLGAGPGRPAPRCRGSSRWLLARGLREALGHQQARRLDPRRQGRRRRRARLHRPGPRRHRAGARRPGQRRAGAAGSPWSRRASAFVGDPAADGRASEPTPGSGSRARRWLEIVAIAGAPGGRCCSPRRSRSDQDDGGSLRSPSLTFLGHHRGDRVRTGLRGWLSAGQRRQTATSSSLAAFVVAFLFPFTQNGSDANMSIATQVLIFAATAIGLNIVVGLAGLLDLGYIAFLGAGAFTAAILSRVGVRHASTWKPPFLVVVLHLRLRLGDARPAHRLADAAGLRRLPGDRHPRLRRDLPHHDEQPGRQRRPEPRPTAANGIPAIPNLNLFGFDFGASHTIARHRRSDGSPTTTS